MYAVTCLATRWHHTSFLLILSHTSIFRNGICFLFLLFSEELMVYLHHLLNSHQCHYLFMELTFNHILNFYICHTVFPILSFYLSIFMTKPCCFNYFSFTIHFPIFYHHHFSSIVSSMAKSFLPLNLSI